MARFRFPLFLLGAVMALFLCGAGLPKQNDAPPAPLTGVQDVAPEDGDDSGAPTDATGSASGGSSSTGTGDSSSTGTGDSSSTGTGDSSSTGTGDSSSTGTGDSSSTGTDGGSSSTGSDGGSSSTGSDGGSSSTGSDGDSSSTGSDGGSSSTGSDGGSSSTGTDGGSSSTGSDGDSSSTGTDGGSSSTGTDGGSSSTGTDGGSSSTGSDGGSSSTGSDGDSSSRTPLETNAAPSAPAATPAAAKPAKITTAAAVAAKPAAAAAKPAAVAAAVPASTRYIERNVSGLGWVLVDTVNDQYVKGHFVLPDGRMVYYDSQGSMVMRSVVLDGMTYYYDAASGALLNQKGESQVVGKGWYYLDPKTGKYAKGFVTLPDGRTVYYGDDYVMRLAPVTVNGMPYDIAPNGALQNTPGERFVPGRGWTYVDPKTRQYQKGFVKLPDGRVVYYNDNYAMQQSPTVFDGMTYNFAGNGALQNQLGESLVGGRGWVYLNPKTYKYAKGFTSLPDGRVVYYNENHAMLQSPAVFDGMTYHFAGNGALLNTVGESEVKGIGWYYLDPKTYQYAKGFTTLGDGRVVYYNENHVLLLSPTQINGMPYNFAGNGQLLDAAGEKNLPGRGWVYLDPQTHLYATGLTGLPGGRIVYYDPATRAMRFGETNASGKWYYCDTINGNVALGLTKLPDQRTVFYDINRGMIFGAYKLGSKYLYFDARNGNMLSNGDLINTILQVRDVNTNTIVRSNALDILSRIVMNEVGGANNNAVYQAQTVAAYTWLMYSYQAGTVSPAVGLRASNATITAAVTSVGGQLLTYNGQLALTMYGASDGGITNNAQAYFGRTDMPYLASMQDPYGVTMANQTSTWNATQMAEAIRKMGITPTGNQSTWVTLHGTGSYISGATVCGRNVTAATFYENLWGMYSPFVRSFTYNAHNGTWTAVTSGNGHGMGMSQTGAMYYGRAGWTYQQILGRYYPGAHLA